MTPRRFFGKTFTMLFYRPLVLGQRHRSSHFQSISASSTTSIVFPNFSDIALPTAFNMNVLFRQSCMAVLGYRTSGRRMSATGAAWKLTEPRSQMRLQIPQRQGMSCFSSRTPAASSQLAEQIENSASVNPEIFTADELHYVPIPGTHWQLALWRYIPPPTAPARRHPLLLLSGIGTNAIGFDLDPSVSLARNMTAEGFETWILEVRGAGLSKKVVEPDGKVSRKIEPFDDSNHHNISSEISVDEFNDSQKSDKTTGEIMKSVTKLSDMVVQLSQRLRSILDAGHTRVLSARLVEQISALLADAQFKERFKGIKDRLINFFEERQSFGIASQIVDLRKWLAQSLEDAQLSVSQLRSLQDRLNSTFDDFQKFLELIENYDWDFDNYLEEEVPIAMQYIRQHSQPQDGKLLAVGHSMGGILLYALLATKGKDSGLAGVVTIASALNYGVSNSSLKLLLPLADPIQVLNVPVIPLGSLMTALHPLVSRPPYSLAWLGTHVSFGSSMDPSLFEKLVLNNFCTIPVKLLLHLSSVFQPGGLCDRHGTLQYKSLLKDVNIRVLALAADEDLICPPSAVLDTVEALPEDTALYKLFGGQNDQHYGHYDLLCSRLAKAEVFPVIKDFLVECDKL